MVYVLFFTTIWFECTNLWLCLKDLFIVIDHSHSRSQSFSIQKWRLLYNSANVTSDDKGSTHILVVALAPSLGTNYSATQRVRHQTDSLLTTRVAFLAGIAARFLRVISSVWGRFINAWCWLMTAVLQKRDVTSWNATLLELIYCHVTCVVVTYRGSSLSANQR